MDKQAEVHDKSWNRRKPNEEGVLDKPRVQKTISKVVSLLASEDYVFDLGCGNGAIGKQVQKSMKNVKFDGCDISEEAVSRARDSYRTVTQTNVDSSGVPAGSEEYDMVICTDVLEHLLDPEHALSEMERILKGDGVVVVSTPNYGYLRYRWSTIRGKLPSILYDERHFQAYTVQSLTELAIKAGFRVKGVEGTGRWEKFAENWPSLFSKTLIFELEKQS